jgi:hypothetical protein
LKEPGSARFGAIGASRDTTSGLIYVCGFVNAKNSFGGFTGMQPFSGGLTNISGLPPRFSLIGVGGNESAQQARLHVCRQNSAL